jgi:hypothetical protein
MKKGRVVFSTYTAKKMKISRLIKLTNFQNARYDTVHLKVRYSKDYDNEGYYTDTTKLHKAYRAFLEVINEF